MFGSKVGCSCLEEIAGVWKCVSSWNEVNFDDIIQACEKAVDFSIKLPSCKLRVCPSESTINETLLDIYEKLINLLEFSISTHIQSPLLAQRSPPTSSDKVENNRPSQSTVNSGAELAALSMRVAQSENNVLCPMSRMFLGDFELDEEQRTVLSLEISCQTLKNLAYALQNMGCRSLRNEEKAVERAITMFSQVMKILGTSTTALINMS